ncbi:MAG TPA: DUF3090 family protein [Acidimicrobiales bacterium]|nr:DUF3090 family protein [Acidimicrobiales bacterium]
MPDDLEFSDLDRITVGTVGTPGRRVFLLQLRAGMETLTIKLEKQQVAAMAEALVRTLAELHVVGDMPGELELEQPFEVAWVVGSMGLGYLEALDRLVLTAEEFVSVDENEEPEREPVTARLFLTREQGAALALRSTALVASGRPPCPLCGFPLDSAGHTCPRKNGKTAPER